MRYSKRRLDSSANERCREEVIADQVKNYLEQMGIDLEGSILDIASGPFSLGCICNDVHGHHCKCSPGKTAHLLCPGCCLRDLCPSVPGNF